MWEQANKVFAEANKVFELADEVFKEARAGVRTETVTKDLHIVRFKAEDLKERRRLFLRFLRMAWQCLWNGSTEFRFKAKQTINRADHVTPSRPWPRK